MVVILYIILGLAVGIGLTLVYLQERLIRERRLTVTMGESERLKAAALIKDVQAQMDEACARHKEDIAGYKGRLDALSTEFQQRSGKLEEIVREKDIKLAELSKENSGLQENLAACQDEIKELQGELTFFKGEAARVDKGGKMLAVDDDSIVLAESGHLLPGAVVRALMKGDR
jgi:septal ring factor EnvC (AmiA/AmiB activator)